MTRNNILYLAVGALVVVAALLGYQVYQDQKQSHGVHIDVGSNGFSINNK
jgi:predicted negative regulator of RcsB-dependent stress response